MFLCDVFAGPGLLDFGEELQKVKGTLAEVVAVANVVVVVVEDKGYVEFMADGEEVVDSPALLRGSVRNFYNKYVIVG